MPDFFELMSITSLFKNKGLRSDLSNERGIFNIAKVRSIFEKVIYSGIYERIDNNMSFSNGGGRRNRNIRDNLPQLMMSLMVMGTVLTSRDMMSSNVLMRCGTMRH